MVDGIKLFKGTIGDAGVVTTTYFGVVKGSIVRIELKSAANPMDEPSSNMNGLFEQFDTNIAKLKVV